MKLHAQTRTVKLKTYKWKTPYEKRKRCNLCIGRKRIIYRCGRCKKGVCVQHSILICKKCRSCPKRSTFDWKLPNSRRRKCRLCKFNNKIPYRCNVCTFGACDNHAILLCKNCNYECCLLQKL